MKHHKKRSGHKRRLAQAVLAKLHAKRYAYQALGAALIGTVATTSGWAKDEAVLSEVVVTGKQEKKDPYKPEKASSVKYTESLLDTPQTINIVSKEVIEEQNATTLRDVLRNVPGISVQAGEGGTPAGDQMTIRGFSARTDMFIDGMRDFGGYSRDPFNVEQVEVVKGPGSAYTGRGSSGGSINMVSKAPTLERSRSGSVGVGSSQYQRYTIDVNEPVAFVNGMAVRVNALYHDSEVAGRDIAENQRWGFAPAIALGLGSPTRVTLEYFTLSQDNMPDYGIPWVPTSTSGPLRGYSDQPSPASWENFYGLKDRDYEKTKVDLVTGKVEHDFSDDLSVKNQTRYGRSTRDSIITPPRFASINTSTDIARTDWKSRDQVTTILDNQTDFTIKFKTAEIEHTLVPGVEFTHETDRNGARMKMGPNSSNTSLYDPNPDDNYTENIVPTGARLQTTVDTAGIYVFDTLKLNEQWELNGGLRYDYFNVDYVSVNTAGAYDASLGHIDRTLSWRSGVVYKPKANGSVYAAYGTSFNPSAEGLATTTLNATPTSTSNINLDPEETETYEVGTKWDLLNERLGVNAAIFRTNKTNARTEDPNNAGDVAVLEGIQRVDGLELGLTGTITEKWKASAAYTYMVSRIMKSRNVFEVGNQINNTPNNTFSLWTTYDLPFNLQVGAGAQYVGERYNSNANTREAPDYITADAMLAYKVNKDITMRLNVRNLTDTEYIDRMSGGHFIPGEGRTVTVTTDFKF